MVGCAVSQESALSDKGKQVKIVLHRNKVMVSGCQQHCPSTMTLLMSELFVHKVVQNWLTQIELRPVPLLNLLVHQPTNLLQVSLPWCNNRVVGACWHVPH